VPEVTAKNRYILRSCDPRSAQKRPITTEREQDVQSGQIVWQGLSREQRRAGFIDHGREVVRQKELEAESVGTFIELLESVPERRVSCVPINTYSHVSGSC
jgi:hypothetical protein